MGTVRRHLITNFGGLDLLRNGRLLDPTATKGQIRALQAQDVDLFYSGALKKRNNIAQVNDALLASPSNTQVAGQTGLVSTGATYDHFWVLFPVSSSVAVSVSEVTVRAGWNGATLAVAPDSIQMKIFLAADVPTGTGDGTPLAESVLYTNMADFWTNPAPPTNIFEFPTNPILNAGTSYVIGIKYTYSGSVSDTTHGWSVTVCSDFTATSHSGSVWTIAGSRGGAFYSFGASVVQGIYNYQTFLDASRQRRVMASCNGVLFYDGAEVTKYAQITPGGADPGSWSGTGSVLSGFAAYVGNNLMGPGYSGPLKTQPTGFVDDWAGATVLQRQSAFLSQGEPGGAAAVAGASIGSGPLDTQGTSSPGFMLTAVGSPTSTTVPGYLITP